jgi:hypothetical protein
MISCESSRQKEKIILKRYFDLDVSFDSDDFKLKGWAIKDKPVYFGIYLFRTDHLEKSSCIALWYTLESIYFDYGRLDHLEHTHTEIDFF